MTSSSTRSFKEKACGYICCLLLGTLLLTGCEGPSTAVLSGVSEERAYEDAKISSVVPASSAERLSDTVEILYTGNVRDDESETVSHEAVTDPSVYVLSCLRGLSYDVAQSGEIIEAVLRADSEDSDVCLIMACYGGSGTGTCASDICAGTAVLLEIAENLAEFSGDTEIRFVFLPGVRSDTRPVYTYLTEIYTPDPERLLGAVVIGALGLNRASENELGCACADETFMAQQINRISSADLGSECICTSSTEGVQNVLLRNSIPVVVYRQKETADTGTVLDCPAIIDYAYLQESADILSRTLALLIGDTTPSMQARAHYTDIPRLSDKGTYAGEDDIFLQFGKSEHDFESVTGLLGEKISENSLNNGAGLSVYRFPLQWFGTDDALPTDLYYLSDSLQGIEIKAHDAGLDFDTVYSEAVSCYGESTGSSEGPFGTAFEWELPMQRVCLALAPEREGYSLSFTEYDTPRSVYPSDSLGCSRLESLYKQVIPEKDRENMSFQAYTDGYGGTMGSLAGVFPIAGSGNCVLGLDLDDALNKNAGYKDKLQTVGELCRLYGEYLAESEAAVYYDDYNSRFGGDENDFAESFRLFSLAGTPREEAGPAADPVRFFYDFDELKDFRDTVRGIR